MSSPQLRSTSLYKIEKEIDSGNFGKVFKISINEDHKVYALKQIKFDKIDEKGREQALKEAKTENDLLRKGIPNVLKSFGSYYNPKEGVYIFSTELMEMNLSQFIQNKGPMTFNSFFPVFRDIISGNNDKILR